MFLPAEVLAQVCSFDNLRTGGAMGDNFIGPTCDNDGTYRSCYYAEGANHPVDGSQYALAIDGVPAAVVFDQQVDSGTSVLCTAGLPAGVGLVDVFAQLEPGCDFTAPDLYEAPDCMDLSNCAVTGIRLGGEMGDTYIGPTCNANGTYRTCYYVTAANLPDDTSQFMLQVDGVPTDISFSSKLNSNVAVVCAAELPTSVSPVDVFIEVQPACSLLEEDLYVPPMCQDMETCSVQSIRLGGQEADSYIGPTCNADGTFRTCFYAEGFGHPADTSQHLLQLNGTPTDINFNVNLSSTTSVVCVSSIESTTNLFDVYIETQPACGLLSEDLFEGLECQFEPAQVTACKYDTDGTPQPGWTMNLGGPAPDSGVTGADGCVTFTVEQSGDFMVSETPQAGWTAISPVEGSYPVTVEADGVYGPFDFVNFENGIVTACKEDTSGRRLGGWTMLLQDDTGATLAEGVTQNENGCVDFPLTGPGSYRLSEVLQVEWFQVEPEAGYFEFTAGNGYQETFTFVNVLPPPVPAISRAGLLWLSLILALAAALTIQRRRAVH